MCVCCIIYIKLKRGETRHENTKWRVSQWFLFRKLGKWQIMMAAQPHNIQLQCHFKMSFIFFFCSYSNQHQLLINIVKKVRLCHVLTGKLWSKAGRTVKHDMTTQHFHFILFAIFFAISCWNYYVFSLHLN